MGSSILEHQQLYQTDGFPSKPMGAGGPPCAVWTAYELQLLTNAHNQSLITHGMLWLLTFWAMAFTRGDWPIALQQMLPPATNISFCSEYSITTKWFHRSTTSTLGSYVFLKLTNYIVEVAALDIDSDYPWETADLEWSEAVPGPIRECGPVQTVSTYLHEYSINTCYSRY